MKNENEKLETAVLGGGCFWCLEAVYLHVKGVESVVSGYAGGQRENPTYEEVSSGETGHAEVVKIGFDPEKISYEDILRIFFSVHDPTTPNRQGGDVGTQYRSIILYVDEDQRNAADLVRNEFTDQAIYGSPIVTELAPLEKFYPAEEYHQRYFEKNPEKAYCQAVVAPKLSKFRKKFEGLYK
ncbi:MAG TPA: peptide-methionine (S)-S-oxide reductase [Candidatus Moranbacteria bacterium]|nr:peptide-methionine (S)-S-oxide reductase [Candidatus Moranbacteria bacterium]